MEKNFSTLDLKDCKSPFSVICKMRNACGSQYCDKDLLPFSAEDVSAEKVFDEKIVLDNCMHQESFNAVITAYKDKESVFYTCGLENFKYN